jgi:glycosyltransferase involved in cell wall biosynthesis
VQKKSLLKQIAVVIPSYKVSKSLPAVVQSLGSEISIIIVVDDSCPEKSGEILLKKISDPRVILLTNEINLGVGGATIRGFAHIISEFQQISVVVKVDGDGQMDTSKILELINPIVDGKYDYAKGNRFIDFESIQEMPKIRVLGNAILSIFSKFSSGYWHILDPNNGYLAISTTALRKIPLSKVDKRFFFESDMLFRLNLINARVIDVPMKAKYGDEISNLKIRSTIFKFLTCHSKNFTKRITYKYFLQGMSVGSIELISGIAFLGFGVIFGLHTWINANGVAAPTGSIVLSSMTIILGFQMLLAFINYDIARANSDLSP